MSADGSRLAILVSVTLTCLGPGLCGAKAQAQDGHVIAVLLDDSGSMSYPIGQPEASDPDGSAGFAVTQLVRFLPPGTRLLLFTYASIDNEQNLRERGGVLYESPVLSDANRDRVSDEIAASILTRNRELMAAPTAGAVLHPYAFRHTPCSRAIAAVSSHLAASFQIPPPKGIEIIYLSDGVCIDGPPVGEESPVPASLLVGFPKDASGLPARFYFIRFRSKTASERLGVWSADGLEKEGTLTRLTNGATQEVNDKDPLAAFEVFGKIVDHIENRQATRIVPPLPALDYGQALGVNLLYTERCTTQNRCDSCERHRQVAEQRQMGGRFQTGRWGWPDAVRGTAGAFLRRQAPGAEPDRFCWVYARLLADDVQAFKPLLDEIEQPANRANRKAVIRADFKFQLELVPYEGNCGVMKGPSVQGGTAGVEEACVEGRILACTDTCEGATWSSLNLAFAKNATRSGMPPRLAGEIAVDGKSGTNNVDATASRDSPVWKLGVDLAECKDKTGAEHKKEVAFAARFGGRDIGDGLRQTLCRKCTDQDKDGICALDDCNDGDGSVNDRLSEKLAKDCIVPDRESGGPCGRSKWICNGKSYVCPPPPYDPKKPELCNRLDDNCDGRVDEGWSGDEPECPVTYWSWRVKEGAGSGAPEGDKSCTCSLDSDGNVVVDFGIVGSLGRTCTCPIAAELRQKVDGELTTAPDKVWFRLGLGEGYAKKLRNGANNCFEVKPDKPSWTITNGDNKIALTLVAVPENPGCGGLIESGKLSFRLDARLVPVETMPTSPEGKALTEYGVKLSGSFGAGIEASANPVFFHVLPDSTSSDDRTSPHILLTSASQSPVSVALGDLEINLLDDQGQAVAPFPARLEDFRESPWLWFES
ncbi:MAG: hypothetical protein FJ109_19450, partial [Deltaproteobacteria bacterium]|nr:hypothetical protein [Deltaproteobacteria bacterium]